MDSHKEILIKVEREISAVGGSNVIYLPTEMLEKAKWKIGDKVTLSLEQGKHGIFLAVWKG